jgi:hypothetical protein
VAGVWDSIHAVPRLSKQALNDFGDMILEDTKII